MYWKIGLIEWGTVKPAVAVIWMMVCFILKCQGSIFLIKPYFWKNIHKFFLYSRFKFQMLDGLPCTSSHVRRPSIEIILYLISVESQKWSSSVAHTIFCAKYTLKRCFQHLKAASRGYICNAAHNAQMTEYT